MKRLIDSINTPDDLKKLPISQLPKVAAEIRQSLIATVSETGGHLAPSLGVVELTIALHYCFNAPKDKIVWDVGHQAYAHKILTGRRDTFHTLRQHGGISGFPRISESPYDALSVGHASTSISAGLGMAIGRDLLREKSHVVSIIGDGSLSGGLAFEGLNNLGIHSGNMTIILNDNAMSISRNVGALSRYLTKVITDKRFNKIKNEIWEMLGNLSSVGKGIRSLVQNIDVTLKHFVIPGKLFEDMGLRYLGPIDGHNLPELIETLSYVRDASSGPVLIHVLTTKGKGHAPAERDATKYHGVSASIKQDCAITKPALPGYSKVFGDELCHIAKEDQRVVAITAGMADGTGLVPFREAFPGRFFDVGIAESHAVTFAAGLALKGFIPVFAVYSTFIQRSYDQIMHDIALDNLHAVFCIDRAGLVGDDGPTHHGIFDLSFLRTIPNITILAPSDAEELRQMLRLAISQGSGPVCIRYPRGAASDVSTTDSPTEVLELKPQVLTQGATCALVAIGEMVTIAKDVQIGLEAKGISTTLINARILKPLNEAFYANLVVSYANIITLEPNTLTGGFGSAILEFAHRQNLDQMPKITCIGYPDSFITHGNKELLHQQMGLDTETLITRIAASLQDHKVEIR